MPDMDTQEFIRRAQTLGPTPEDTQRGFTLVHLAGGVGAVFAATSLMLAAGTTSYHALLACVAPLGASLCTRGVDRAQLYALRCELWYVAADADVRRRAADRAINRFDRLRSRVEDEPLRLVRRLMARRKARANAERQDAA